MAEKVLYIRRIPPDNYFTNQTVNITIGAGGGSDSDTVESVMELADDMLEIHTEGGDVYVVPAFKRKE
jgi:hypothetical protein